MLQNGGLMALIGAVLGLSLALGEHLLINHLRQIASQLLGGIGLVLLALLAAAVLFIVANFALGKDPTGISLMVALLGVILIAAVCGMASVHFKRDNISFVTACGQQMVQFGIAAALCYTIAQVLPNVAARLNGGTPTDSRMTDWFPPFHRAADALYGVLLVALILLEIVRPLRFFAANTPAPTPAPTAPNPR